MAYGHKRKSSGSVLWHASAVTMCYLFYWKPI